MASCGSEEPAVEDSDIPIAGTCVNGGDVTGCLVYESDSCNGDIALNSVKGGHFYMDGGHLMVLFAANNDNVEMTFEIVDTMGLATGVTYTIPDRLLVTLTDRTDPDDAIRHFGCEGELTVTSYEEGKSLHGQFTLSAATTAGSCHLSEWYTGEGSFTNLSFCQAKDG